MHRNATEWHKYPPQEVSKVELQIVVLGDGSGTCLSAFGADAYNLSRHFGINTKYFRIGVPGEVVMPSGDPHLNAMHVHSSLRRLSLGIGAVGGQACDGGRIDVDALEGWLWLCIDYCAYP